MNTIYRVLPAVFVCCAFMAAQGPLPGSAGLGGSSSGTGGVFINATGCGSNACVASPSPAITSYTNLVVNMKIDAPNTAAATLNVGTPGAKAILYGGSPLTASALNSTAFVYALVYDGTSFDCTNCGNGFTYSYLRPISQNSLATAPVSIAHTNYNVSNSVEGANAGKISTAVTAWTYGTTPFVHNATEDTAMAFDFLQPLPPSWIPASGLTFKVTWQLPAGSSGVTGNLKLYARAAPVCTGSAPGNFSAPIGFTASATGAASVWTDTATLTATTSDILSGASAGCNLLVQIFRDATNTIGSGDTLSDSSASPATDAQFVILTIGTPGGAGGTQGATGATGAAGAAGSTTRSLGYMFAGSDLVNNTISGAFPMPSTCTLAAWDIDNKTLAGASATDSQTIKVAKVATGTTSPGAGNLINTSGIAISSAAHVHSTVLSDFTTTTFTQYDLVAFDLTSYGGVAAKVTVTLSFTGCQ